MLATVNVAWANSLDWRPSAEILWLPGVAEAGTVTEMGPKLPAPSAPAIAASVVSKKTSTPSSAPKPVPETVTVKVGGPMAEESAILAVTVKLAGRVVPLAG